ncbi:MAG: hypothetical protein V3S55_06530 [Nitrospiraceae bacterium]
MTDMLSVVARAIAGVCNDKGQELASKCEMQAPPIPWQAFKREAKAALEAMRSPTDEMLLVGARSIGKTMGVANHIERSRPCWQAMIDKALEGKDD